MNYRVLLVDDEPLILKSLIDMVPWAQLECEVVGSACSGEEAERLFKSLRPELVITDINMPGMSGLELIKRMAASRHVHKVVVLSAYGDFSYAQQAMANGVTQYVLKPIETEKLLGAIRSSLADLAEKRRQDAMTQDLETTVQCAQKHAFSSLLFDIARYGSDITWEEKELLARLDGFRHSVVVAVRIFNVPRGGGNGLGEAMRFYDAAMQRNGYSILPGSWDRGLLFACPVEKGIALNVARARVVGILEQIGRSFDPARGMPVAGVSDIYRDCVTLHVCYRQCMELMEEAFFCERPTVLYEFRPRETAEPADMQPVLNRLTHGDVEGVRRAYDQWSRALALRREENSAAYTMRELHRRATLAAVKAGMTENPEIAAATAMGNFCTMRKALGNYLEQVALCVQKSQTTPGRLEILMNELYSDSGLNLTMLADRMQINSSYLSRLFKKKFGENFSAYLLEMRLRQARELLRTTQFRSSEIARMVGIEDAHYFSQVFKKQCGMTPSQYRESCAEGEK